MMKKSKYDRILSLYAKLCAGEEICKAEAAEEFSVNERTVQRDIDDIRAFFVNNMLGIGHGKRLIYDRRRNVYRLEDEDNVPLTNGEFLAVCILLAGKDPLLDKKVILEKLLEYCTAEPDIVAFFREEFLLNTDENKNE